MIKSKVGAEPKGITPDKAIKDFEANTPEKVVELAYNWCVENRLISIN